MPAEKGWKACCHKVMGDDVKVVYEPVIGWALVERKLSSDGPAWVETLVEPLFMEPDAAHPIIPSALYAFKLFALVGPDEDVDQDAVVAQIKEGLAERNQGWTSQD